MRQVLLVFGKIPSAGAVKTRLTPEVRPEDASRLYGAFLADALDQYREIDADVHLYLVPPLHDLRSLEVPEGMVVREQVGVDLGERMARAFEGTFAAGCDAAVVVGTDHPTLPTAFVDSAFEALRVPGSVVVGPAEDGGYYLLGMNHFFPDLFRDMDYSHEHVFDQARARAVACAARVRQLPVWYDVDTPASLVRLAADLEQGDAPAPRTRAILREFAARYAWLNA